jgi:hypothetical protein
MHGQTGSSDVWPSLRAFVGDVWLNVEFLLGDFVDLHGDWRKLSIINGDDLTGIPSLLLSSEARRQTV